MQDCELEIIELQDFRSSERDVLFGGVRESTSKSDELQKRFVSFAARIVRVARALPRTEDGRHISKQLCAVAQRLPLTTGTREAQKAERILFTNYESF